MTNRSSEKADILIIGAGISGLSFCYYLAQKKINQSSNKRICLIESQSLKGLLQNQHSAVVLEPAFSVGDDKVKIFNQQAYFSAQKFYKQLPNSIRHSTGLIKIATANHLIKKEQKLIELIKENPQFKNEVYYLDKTELSDLSKINLSQSGLYYPNACLLNPNEITQSIIELSKEKIDFLFDQSINSILQKQNGYEVLNKHNQVLVAAKKIIYCGGFSGLDLIKPFIQNQFSFTQTKGQISMIDENQITIKPKITISGEGFITPVLKSNAINNKNHICFGSSWIRDFSNSDTQKKEHLDNINKINKLSAKNIINPQAIDGNHLKASLGIRLNTSVRTPAFKEVAKDFFVFTAMGSRGYQYAPHLAYQLQNCL